MSDVATSDHAAGDTPFDAIAIPIRVSNLTSEECADEDQHEMADRANYAVDREDRREIRDGIARAVPETLQQVRRKLCLIELCWPEIQAATATDDLYAQSLPDAYRRVADKERLLLWYAENFRRQFHTRHVDRKPLLLACDNECGVQRFVSTTIRRRTLPYPELYTWQGCASFVSDYVRYEAPDEAFLMPSRLRSPTWVLHFQRGNNFECATLLVSLLLGQSYNAFVASGYASREQILCDLTRIPCPYLPAREEATNSPVRSLPTDAPKINKYKLQPPSDFRSQFLLELEEREKQKRVDELHSQEEEQCRMIAERERPQPDKYFGHRVHSWVVILPEDKGARSQEIVEPIFIEPSSGVSYRPSDYETDLLYQWVESIWNDTNYWVNMQPRGKGCTAINWDLSKTHLWEHLLPGEPRVEREDVDAIEEDIVQQNKHLDMPTSYVKEIQIDSVAFRRRYPEGEKTIFYKKAKVELYAPYVQEDGMVRRVTIYEDYDYTTPIKRFERYSNRSDSLVESTIEYNTEAVTDSFEKGRADHCKAHRYSAHYGDVLNSERIIDYYSSGRLDGLSRVETGFHHLTQHYIDREDFLYYRHIQFSAQKDSSVLDSIRSRRITRIIEKYHRNKKIPACEDMAVREFAMVENEICVKFHYDNDRCTRATRTFVKPSVADRGDHLVFDPTMTSSYNPDPAALPEKNLDLFHDLNRHLKDEDQAISYVRDAESEVMFFLRKRAEESTGLQLITSLFDETQITEAVTETERRTEAPSRDLFELSQFGPYLARIGNPSHVSKAEKYLLRVECLGDLKKSSVDKANRILHSIQEHTAELEKMQAMLLQTAELSRAEEEQIIAKINETSFNLHVLETYLSRHRDAAPAKYRALVERLQ